MNWKMIFNNLPILLFVLLYFGGMIWFFVKLHQKRRKYQNRNLTDPFFLEDGKFVINTGFPKEYAVDRIDYIEMQYREVLSKFWIYIRIVYKDGTKDKYLTDHGSILRPRLERLQSELEQNGVRYKMVEYLG